MRYPIPQLLLRMPKNQLGLPVQNHADTDQPSNEITIGTSPDYPYIEPNDAMSFTAGTLYTFLLSVDGKSTDKIQFQVTTDDGSSWKYWNGSIWASAEEGNESETSNIDEINNNIDTLDDSGGLFKWRAYFLPEGSDDIELNTVTVEVDTFAPTVTLTDDTIYNTENAKVTSTEAGTVYLVNEDITVSNINDIIGAAANQYNERTINTGDINMDVTLEAEGLIAGTYKAYAEDEAGNLSAASANTVTIILAEISYADNFIEGQDNDGSITGSRTAEIAGDTFTKLRGSLSLLW